MQLNKKLKERVILKIFSNLKLKKSSRNVTNNSKINGMQMVEYSQILTND